MIERQVSYNPNRKKFKFSELLEDRVPSDMIFNPSYLGLVYNIRPEIDKYPKESKYTCITDYDAALLVRNGVIEYAEKYIEAYQRLIEDVKLAFVDQIENSKDDSLNLTKYDKLPIVITGRKIRKARLNADLTQSQLAEMIGVPQTHISAYEKDKRKVPQNKVEKLTEILNLK